MKALLLLVCVGAAAIAQDHTPHHRALPPSDAQIVVSINPEARVSVVLAAPLPSPSACGSATELKVKVINQGFITAPLRASIVVEDASRVSLRMDDAKLSGKVEESRALHLFPIGPDPVDVTIAFSIDKNIGDLGGRDRVHFVVRCSAASASLR